MKNTESRTVPAVEAEGLKKYFARIRALDGVFLSIPGGTIYGLLGPNGAGKTTLIRSLMGLVRLDGGTVRVLGRSMPQEASSVLSDIGYMTQVPALYNDLSVWENMDFFGRVFGLDNPAERKVRIREVLQLVELDNRPGTPLSQLSGGMRQRASLACTLVHRPRLLLLDEPTVGIDPQLRNSFWAYFRTLSSEGTTLVVSSHVMDEAERCDRLGLMRAGKVLAEGTEAELRARTCSSTLEKAFLTLCTGEGGDFR